MAEPQRDIKKISFTGDGQGHFKTFYDLPYAKELYDLTTEKRLDYEDISKSERRKIIPLFEARHKSTISVIKQIVKEKGIRQILDMGSGLSGVGLIMTDLYPDLIFIEVDLPEMIEKKETAVYMINKKLRKSTNLYFFPGDVRDSNEVQKAIAPFDLNKPSIVIMEGLFSYYDDSDKIKILENAKKIQGRDGYIITPDPSMDSNRRKIFKILNVEESARQVAEKAGRSFERHGFQNEELTDEFFKNQGFRVEKFRPEDYTMNSFKNLDIDKVTEKILKDDIKKNAKVWVLKIAP